jgi:hypothetical protein
MSKPKRESSVLERIPKTVASEVKDFKKKKGIATFYEALKFVILADKKWKKAETERKEKIQNDTRKECEDRHRHIDESHVKQIAKLEIDLKASNSKIEALNSKVIEKDSENGKLKWQLKANADIARAEIVQKDAEITQKESEIAKLNAEIEKGPSSNIMKENSEMKETIQSLESQLNETRNKARVLLYDERL